MSQFLGIGTLFWEHREAISFLTPFLLLDQLALALETNPSLWKEQDPPGAVRKEGFWCHSYL